MYLEDRLESLLRADPWRMKVLRVVSRLGLPEHAAGAGFVRSAVWDHLQGYEERTSLSDIDVLFFDSGDLGRNREDAAERELRRLLPGEPWQVRNQARMYMRNGDPAYTTLDEALSQWLETATAVAVRLDPDGGMCVVAPFGLEDLFTPRSRPTPAGQRRREAYLARMRAKNWPGRWPMVTVEGLDGEI